MTGSSAQQGSFQLLNLSRPVYAYLELTYRCGNSCPGCQAVTGRDQSEMSGREWISLISHLSTFMTELRLSGGEPTLHPEFPDIIESLKKEKCSFRIYTNGLWPDTGRIMKALKGSGNFRGFIFSLHGSAQEIHQFFTGPVDFERIISNIEISVKEGFPVDIATVLGEFNRGNVPGILKLSTGIGSRRHHFLRYIGPYRGGISLYREDLAELLSQMGKIPSGIFSYRIGECFPRCFYRGGTRCLAGITNITITPSGGIKACPFSSEVLGKWNVERKRHSGKKKIDEWTSDFNEACLRCDEIAPCMGGCRVMRRNFGFSRDPLMGEPLKNECGEAPVPEGKPISLNGGIKLAGTVRQEPFGYILISEEDVIPLTDRGYAAAALCDGTRNMEEVIAIAGKEAEDFLLSLYLRGFLELV
ncbi:MAG: radical SAM protein [Vulcanimicrobiota bacterium]